MTSYEEFMIILTIGLLIISILNLRNKQAASSQGRAGGLLTHSSQTKKAIKPLNTMIL